MEGWEDQWSLPDSQNPFRCGASLLMNLALLVLVVTTRSEGTIEVDLSHLLAMSRKGYFSTDNSVEGRERLDDPSLYKPHHPKEPLFITPA